jgi:hypothetical protein
MTQGVEAISSRKAIAAVLIVLAVAQLIYSIKLIGATSLRWKSQCELWDRDARDLISRDPALATLPAVLQLLRDASEYCQSGRMDLARQQYDALRVAHDVRPTMAAMPVTGSIK